jgi:anti-anti-sigma regulatory factor
MQPDVSNTDLSGESPRAEPPLIVLPADLDLTSAAQVHTKFVAALEAGAIRLDGSLVQRADTAGVQLLCALVIAAERRGVVLALTAVSPALVTCVKLLGAQRVIRLDGVRQEGLEWFE